MTLTNDDADTVLTILLAEDFAIAWDEPSESEAPTLPAPPSGDA